MSRRWVLCVVMAVGLQGLFAGRGWASGNDEERVSIDQVPAAVKATILKEAKNGTIKGIERETEKGQTVYEAEIIIDGKEIEIEVAADGTLLEREEEVSLDEVPAAVKATILKEAKGAAITEVERESSKGKTFYEAEWVEGGKEVEIKVAADGTLLGREVEEEDEDDDEAIPLDRVPPKAREALLKCANGAKFTEIERETIRGVVFYEAEWMIDGREHEAKVTADGALVELEEAVDAKDVPASVREAAAKAFPKSAKLKFEKKMIVIYEVEAKVDGKEREILISPCGKVHGDHDDDGDDDEHEDDDD
ncbi:MAG: PepSY-like domain-containing protein [Phycisphaerae bacterium]|nr:PepSY-like domain-containing protein [Phycisphaerae bacterium]